MAESNPTDAGAPAAITPAALDDSAFLRRVHLDLVGLLPEADEVRSFIADKSPDKRAKLIDSLMQNTYGPHTRSAASVAR